MIVLFDNSRHLICAPYGVEELHSMARAIGLKRCWYHGGHRPHYDVPKRWSANDFAELRRRLIAASLHWNRVSSRFILETMTLHKWRTS